MKGVVFTLLNELVEEKFGMDAWEAALDGSDPPLDGVYTAAGTYPDKELFALVGQLSNLSQVPVNTLVHTFGQFMLGKLALLYPGFFSSASTAKEFVRSVDNVIHVEVKKLYPQAELPSITYEDPGPDALVMIYQSPRKLCYLAEGLIDGTAKYYGTEIQQQQTRCVHNGDDHCRFELQFGDSI
ncbi:MAG: heme NO-binding domain-containing protein [Vampirovibrio sp.]|nr:heme NO-binding domain-containing protein [Vampirovibrio sp.]